MSGRQCERNRSLGMLDRDLERKHRSQRKAAKMRGPNLKPVEVCKDAFSGFGKREILGTQTTFHEARCVHASVVSPSPWRKTTTCSIPMLSFLTHLLANAAAQCKQLLFPTRIPTRSTTLPRSLPRRLDALIYIQNPPASKLELSAWPGTKERIAVKRLTPLRDGENMRTHSNGQDWVVSWHHSTEKPTGPPAFD